jgi:hypothetical protein
MLRIPALMLAAALVAPNVASAEEPRRVHDRYHHD